MNEFERERATFQRELPGLLQEHRGKFALILGDTIVGIFDTKIEAGEAGYRQFLREQFMIKEITEHEKPLYFTRKITPCRT